MSLLWTIASVAIPKAAKALIKPVATKVAAKVIKPTITPNVPQVEKTWGWQLATTPYTQFSESERQLEAWASQIKKEAVNKNYSTFAAEDVFQKSKSNVMDFLSNKKEESLFDSTEDKPLEEIVKWVKARSNMTFQWQLTSKLQEDVTDKQKEIESYKKNISEYKTPWNKIEENLKKQIGEKKYNEFKDSLNLWEFYATAIEWDDELKSTIPTFTRSLYKWMAFDKLTDLATWGNQRSINSALDYLQAKWVTEESKTKQFLWQLIGDAPVYLAASELGAAAVGEGLFALGAYANSTKAAQAGMNIIKMQKSNPYLYAATFDSAFGTASEYGIKKATWVDYSVEDGLRSLVLGAVMPKVIGEVASWVSSTVKYGASILESKLKPKDFTTIDWIIKEAIDNWDTTLIQTFQSKSDVKLSDGTTVGDLVESLKWMNKDSSPIDASLSFANKWVALSTRAAKRIDEYVKEINRITDDGGSETHAITWQEVMNKLSESKVHTEESVVKVMNEIEAKNNIKIKKTNIPVTTDDILSEALHSSEFSLTKLKNAKSPEEALEAFKWQPVISTSQIEELRMKINTSNITWAREVAELAGRKWVKFDIDNATDEFGIVNRTYLQAKLDEVESAVIGYTKFQNKLTKELKEKVSSIYSNIKSWARFDAIWIGKEAARSIKEISNDIQVLKWRLASANSWQVKSRLEAQILEKNAQIAKLKSWFETKQNEKKILNGLIKREIESNAERAEYKILSPQVKKAIKDEAKAKIANAKNEDDAIRIVERLNEKLYKESYKSLYNSIKKQMEKVSKEVTSVTKPSKIDPYYVKLMKQVSDAVENEKGLQELHSIKLELSTYEKEGRDIFKENQWIITRQANRDLANVVVDLRSDWKTRLEVTGYNTPESGMGRKKVFLENIQSFYMGNVQSQHYIDRMFGVGSYGAKVFDTDFRTQLTKYILKKHDLLNRVWVGALKSLNIKETVEDSVKNKYGIWRVRNSWGHDYNLWNDIVIKQNKNGAFEYVPKASNDKLGEGEIKFQSLPIEERENILKSIYKEFDDEYANNLNFKQFENELRSHFSEQSSRIEDKWRRLAGKWFPSISNYHPVMLRNKFQGSAIVDENMNYNHYVKDSINDFFMKSRTPPKDVINMNVDLISTLEYSSNTSMYWDSIIEPLLRAEKLYNKLKSWKLNDEYLDEELLTNFNRFTEGGTSGGQYLSPEADSLLRNHMWKLATQWANLRDSITQDGYAAVAKVQEYVIPSLLGWVKTIAKQLASNGDIFMYGGAKNSATGFVATTSANNWREATKLSGYLNDRLPWWKTWEWLYKDFKTDSNNLNITRAFTKRSEYLWNVVGWMLRISDGYTSVNAWMTWLSKYVNEVHPWVIGKTLNVAEIRAKLTPSEMEEAVGYADKFMSKVMWSTHIFDQWIQSQSALSRTIFFLGKTGINRTMLLLEQWAKIVAKNEPISSRVWNTTLLAANVAFNIWYFKKIEEGYNYLNKNIWAKSEEEINTFYSLLGNKIENPTKVDKAFKEIAFIFNTLVVAPWTWVDLSQGFSPVVQYAKKAAAAPTLTRKAEEAAYLAVRGIAGIHNDWINLARFGASKAWQQYNKDFSITNVDNAEYDKAVNSIYSTMNMWESVSFWELRKWVTKNWVTLPSWKDLEEKVKLQKEINKASQKEAWVNKAKADTKKKFIKWAIDKYWNKITIQEFLEYTKENSQLAKDSWIKDGQTLKNLYETISVTWAKSKWEEMSLLMWKSADVIYESKILPLMENGKAWDAFELVKEMRATWVIKSDNWAVQILLKMKQYQESK